MSKTIFFWEEFAFEPVGRSNAYYCVINMGKYALQLKHFVMYIINFAGFFQVWTGYAQTLQPK